MDKKDVLVEFLDLLITATEMEKLIKLSCAFFYNRFKLINCSITYNNHKQSQFSLSPALDTAEKVITKQIFDSNSMLMIKNPKEDMFLRSIKEIDKVKESIVSFPIRRDNKPVGHCTFYIKDYYDFDVEFISLLLSKLSIAISAAQNFDDAKHFAITDSLTTLYNKAYFLEALKNEIIRGKRNNRPTSLIIFDLDDFKLFNDTQGHVEGDKLLQEIGLIVRDSVRSIDIPARYGGEEFVIVLPETSHDHAFDVAERIRKSIEETEYKQTASLGVVTCMNSSIDSEKMIKEADKALYKAKAKGKNITINYVIVDKAINPIDVQAATGNY